MKDGSREESDDSPRGTIVQLATLLAWGIISGMSLRTLGIAGDLSAMTTSLWLLSTACAVAASVSMIRRGYLMRWIFVGGVLAFLGFVISLLAVARIQV